MSRYTGLPCVSCKKTFSDSDDIVVCPDCGAPHHRSCYEALGQCALQDKHDEKFVWQAHIPDADNAHGQSHAVICPNCNAANPANGRFCQMCGTPLPNQAPKTVQVALTVSTVTTRKVIAVNPMPISGQTRRLLLSAGILMALPHRSFRHTPAAALIIFCVNLNGFCTHSTT